MVGQIANKGRNTSSLQRIGKPPDPDETSRKPIAQVTRQLRRGTMTPTRAQNLKRLKVKGSFTARINPPDN